MSSHKLPPRSAGRVLAERLSSLRRDERGAIIVLVAVSMVAFLGMLAMSLDVAGWYQTQRHAQATADSVALAFANDMARGDSTSGATTVALTYATNNGLPISGSNISPNTPSTGQVTVTVPTTAPSYFAQILGFGTQNISAKSVASWSAATGVADGVFAYNSTCSPGSAGITITSNNVNITGALHSNGSFSDTANNSTLGPTTYVGAASCSNVTANHATFTSGPSNSAMQSYPVDYSQSLGTLCPSYTNGNSPGSWSFSNNLTISPGIYCFTGNATIFANNVTATGVTIIANSISISANNATFSPATGAGNLTLYQTAGGWNSAAGTCTSTNSSITSSSNNVTITGDLFAPCSTINVATNNDTANFFEGYNVNLTSNNVSFSGDGPLAGGTSAGDSLTG